MIEDLKIYRVEEDHYTGRFFIKRKIDSVWEYFLCWGIQEDSDLCIIDYFQSEVSICWTESKFNHLLRGLGHQIKAIRIEERKTTEDELMLDILELKELIETMLSNVNQYEEILPESLLTHEKKRIRDFALQLILEEKIIFENYPDIYVWGN